MTLPARLLWAMAVLLAAYAFLFWGCAPSQYHATVGRSQGQLESPNGRDWDNSAWYAETGLSWDLIDLRALERPAPPLELPEPEEEPVLEPSPEPTGDLEAFLGLLAALLATAGGFWGYHRRQAGKG